MGLKLQKPVEKPEALALYEKIQALGIPVRSGGIKDQPHIWMEEYYIVYQEKLAFDGLEAQRLAAELAQRQK